MNFDAIDFNSQSKSPLSEAKYMLIANAFSNLITQWKQGATIEDFRLNNKKVKFGDSSFIEFLTLIATQPYDEAEMDEYQLGLLNNIRGYLAEKKD